MNSLDLSGLKAHHPLGFLAACGLLRCLSEWPDYRSAKLSWKGSRSVGRFAAIHTDLELDMVGIMQVLVCQSKKVRESLAFTWSTKIDDRKKFREAGQKAVQQLVTGGSREDVDVLAALASDLIHDGGNLQRTGFDLTSGSQHFLKSICVLAGSPLTREAVEEALIGPWKYRDTHHALGWDPLTQRLHALRGKLPEKDKEKRSVRAAVFLASQALPLFRCFAVGRGLRTTGFHHVEGDDWFAWPVWSEPIALDTLRSLLSQPIGAELQQRGVSVVYRCRVSHTGGGEGNYRVFGHAEEWSWRQ
jgi:hypothetical protein